MIGIRIIETRMPGFSRRPTGQTWYKHSNFNFFNNDFFIKRWVARLSSLASFHRHAVVHGHRFMSSFLFIVASCCNISRVSRYTQHVVACYFSCFLPHIFKKVVRNFLGVAPNVVRNHRWQATSCLTHQQIFFHIVLSNCLTTGNTTT